VPDGSLNHLWRGFPDHSLALPDLVDLLVEIPGLMITHRPAKNLLLLTATG